MKIQEDGIDLKEIIIPEQVTKIVDWAFAGCSSLEKIIIPDNVTNIGCRAFIGCSNLAEIEIPEHVEKIKVNSFNDCSSLKKITIPEGVSEICLTAFDGCSELTRIDVDENNKEYSSLNGVLYTHDKSKLLKCPMAIELQEMVIPEGVTIIRRGAFECCSFLEKIIKAICLMVVIFWHSSGRPGFDS